MPKPHLSARARRHWTSYIRSIADLMGLKDHRFYLHEEPAGAGHAATIECVYGSDWSTVRLAQSFLDSPPDVQRETVVHELIHAHFAPSDYIAMKEIRPEVYAYWEMNMEYSVDAVSAAWAKSLPLPPVMTPR